jgi:hypothetical protein
MVSFDKIESEGNLHEIIKAAFDAKFPVDGGWGYTKASAIIIYNDELPVTQLEHTIASMRAHLEMSMTRDEVERYGGINLNEVEREMVQDGSCSYHKVTYEITAIREKEYNAFVDEYKEGYGNSDFDLSEYFARRKKATLHRKEIYWFEIKAETAQNL